MGKTYYNRKYFDDRLEGQQSMAFSIWKFLTEIKAKKILDVGCGSGWLVRYLNQKGFKTKGCDLAEEAVKMAKKQVKPSSLIVKASATNLPYKDNSFDSVLGVSIIEHLTKSQAKKFLKEASRVLKKGGWMFLVTPNYATPLRFLMGKNWGGYYDPTHISLYTPWALKTLVKKYPFENLRLTFSYYPDIPFDWDFPGWFLKMPRQVKNIANFLIVSTPFCLLRHSFWLAAQRK